MVGKLGISMIALAGIVVVGGCSRDVTSNCAAEGGARACLIQGSGKTHIEVTGFQPNSDIQVSRNGPANPGETTPPGPMQIRIGADGKNHGVLGIVGIAGPVTFTLSGTTSTGQSVALPLVLGR